MFGLTTKTTTERDAPAPTPSEVLTEAENKSDLISTRLAASRLELGELLEAIAKERESYLSAGVGAELDGGERPSRVRLTQLERQLPDAEDRVTVLERSEREAARHVRRAKAIVLRQHADSIETECRLRQDSVNELVRQIQKLQAEVDDHHAVIRTRGPEKAQQLRNEALQLERQG